MAPARGGYYDLDEVCAQETVVPTTLAPGCTGVGTVLDPSSDLADLLPGAKMEMPLWLAAQLAQRNMALVELPVFYGQKMRRKIRAGAGCEDLRVRCPHYYTVASLVHSAMLASHTADEAFPAFIQATFRGRYKELLTKAPAVESNLEASAIQGRLSLEELALFNRAADGAARYARWRGNFDARALLARAPSIKRKWGEVEAGAASGAAPGQPAAS